VQSVLPNFEKICSTHQKKMLRYIKPMPYGKRKPTRARTAMRAKPTGTRGGAKKAVTKYRAKTFKKAVRTAMQGQLETKRIGTLLADGDYIHGGGLNNKAVNTKGWCISNVYAELGMTRGLTSTQRVGDTIQPTYCVLKGWVKTNHFDPATNISFTPFDVRVIVFRCKDQNIPDTLNMKKDVFSTPPTEIMITGVPSDDMLPFNSFYKVIATRTLRLRPPDSEFLENEAPAGKRYAQINGQLSNAPFYRRFSIRVPCPKVLKYEEFNNTVPTNHWFSVGAYIVDGSGEALDPAQLPAQLWMSAEMSYKDA
jgi:hypothetical protein